jgi:copper chaperone
MQKIHVPDMACGHCSNAITQALQALDAMAEVQVDLENKLVSVSTTAPETAVRAAIVQAGYSPT